jgi:hypothetical protein
MRGEKRGKEKQRRGGDLLPSVQQSVHALLLVAEPQVRDVGGEQARLAFAVGAAAFVTCSGSRERGR